MSSSSLRAWQSILQTPELVAYFKGVFNTIGITVEETREAFTVHHQGSEVAFSEGLAEDVDFVIPLKLENITNLVEHAEDGRIDPDESWKIVRVLFTPMTRATLKTPVLAGTWLRKLAGVEDLIHVHLVHPEGGDAAKHTLAYTAGQWLVIPGLYGVPGRTYLLSPDDALTYQRRVLQAIREDSFKTWRSFATWYRTWREGVSVSA